jgi:hypothetical protein
MSKFTCECCNSEYDEKRRRECSICSATVCEYCIENGKICDDCAGEDDDE